MTEAIVYTSETGFTARYAELLSEKTGLPFFPLNEAAGKLTPGAEIFYCGWLMAGSVKGYKKAASQFSVRAVCGVGMGKTGTQLDDVRRRNAIPDKTPVFTLQGGFRLERLHGLYKFMMKTMIATVGKKLQKKADRTADEEETLSLLLHGGDCVSAEHLTAVLDWWTAENQIN